MGLAVKAGVEFYISLSAAVERTNLSLRVSFAQHQVLTRQRSSYQCCTNAGTPLLMCSKTQGRLKQGAYQSCCQGPPGAPGRRPRCLSARVLTLCRLTISAASESWCPSPASTTWIQVSLPCILIYTVLRGVMHCKQVALRSPSTWLVSECIAPVQGHYVTVTFIWKASKPIWHSLS